jgi:ElaB/YqjD/DUF883 family membrane-anchored ribosome-binding protein
MSARDSLSKSADDLRADLEQLRDDMGAMMKTVSRMANNGQRESVDKLKQVGTVAADQARQGVEVAEQSIVENPFTSVLVAFGAGLLIGKLIKH